MSGTTRRRAALMAAAGVAALAPAGLAPASVSQTVTAPRSGSVYEGSPGQIAIAVSGRRVSLAGFGFRCTGTTGRTSLNDVALKRTSKGYRFEIRARGSITFADGQPDENAAVRLEGRFSRTARSVRGHFRVTSHRCRTGDVAWSARLVGGPRSDRGA